ncbi:MAG: FecR family protein [Parabacteroides sp.]|nr:FecR family protein [Parabacteroides sp.]
MSGIASILFILLLSFGGYATSGWYKESTVVQIYSSLNGKSKVILPDGSNVWLNTESTLEYSTSFWSKKRSVRLKGEAYFEVKKRSESSFCCKKQWF